MTGRGMAMVAASAALVTLAGCGSLNDQFGHSLLVTPQKYQFYNCAQAQKVDQSMAVRQKELEELMERAAKGQGGSLIGNAVYRSPYNQVLGERAELNRVLVEKRCALDSPRASDRTVF